MRAPDPLVPAECTLEGNDWFPFYFDRVRKSKWWRRASDFSRARNVMLWGEAYKATPAGSLPDDDDELAEAAGFGLDIDSFLAAKAELMGAWVLCSDGRWYHPTVCEVALEAWERLSEKRRNEASRKAKQRAQVRENTAKTGNVPRDTANATVGHLIQDRQDTTDKTDKFDANASPPQLVLVVNEPDRQKPDWVMLGWKVYPRKGRERSSVKKVRLVWAKAAKEVGGDEQLLRCIERFSRSGDAVKQGGLYVKAFDVWLKDGRAVNWTPDSEAESHDSNGIAAASGRELENSDTLRSLHAAALEASARSR